MKGRRLFIIAMFLTAASCSVSYAGGWENRNGLWYYEQDDGTHPSEEWLWLDENEDGFAECYYFDSNGYMYSSEGTPDGYWVNAQGAWTENGVVQYRKTTDLRYTEEGLLSILSSLAHGNRESNRTQMPPEKRFERFDVMSGNLTVYYDDDGNFVYLTKHCKYDAVPPLRGLDGTATDVEMVCSQLSGLGYETEQIQYYKVRIHLADGFYADYKPDTKFLILGRESDLE